MIIADQLFDCFQLLVRSMGLGMIRWKEKIIKPNIILGSFEVLIARQRFREKPEIGFQNCA